MAAVRTVWCVVGVWMQLSWLQPCHGGLTTPLAPPLSPMRAVTAWPPQCWWCGWRLGVICETAAVWLRSHHDSPTSATTPDAAIIDFSFIYNDSFSFATAQHRSDILDGRLPARGPPAIL